VNSWVIAACEANCPACTSSTTFASLSSASSSLCNLKEWHRLAVLPSQFQTITSTLCSTLEPSPLAYQLTCDQYCTHLAMKNNKFSSKGCRVHILWLKLLQLLFKNQSLPLPCNQDLCFMNAIGAQTHHPPITGALPSLCPRWRWGLDVMRWYSVCRGFRCCNW